MLIHQDVIRHANAGCNFNTKENWDSLHRELQENSSWLERRKDWTLIARESILIDEIENAVKKYAPAAKKMMEVGPGDGYVIFGLSRRIKDLEITAMDISEESLNMIFAHSPGTRLHCSTIEEMNLGERFDVILAAQVLEHSDNLNEAIERIRGHLMPGGILIAVLPYKWPIDKQHNYTFDDSFIFTLCKRIGSVELVDQSVQYQSKIVVARRAP
jgi:2-polyprenyl-3-methyl-5-hydroxy-6-metoxy-1,4-benzoquinol methylase